MKKWYQFDGRYPGLFSRCKQWFAGLLTLGLILAAPSVSMADPSGRQIEKNIRLAIQDTFSNPPEAQRLMETSFQQSLEMTRPQRSSSARELGFALACKCIHPSLFPEVRIAIETYLKLYPNGPHRKEVLVQKAILDYAEGGTAEAEQALAEAEPLFKGRERAKFKNFQMNGYFSAKKYESAGNFLQDWNATEASSQTKRDIRRWDKGEKSIQEAIQEAVQKASSGDIDGIGASRVLKEALEHGYFSHDAPQAAMDLIQAQDRAAPQYNGFDVTWLGKTRTSWHHLPASIRHEKYLKLLKDYPEADLVFRGNILVSLWLICKYEMDRPTEGEKFLARLAEIPMFEEIAELEKLLSEISEKSLTSDDGGQKLIQHLDDFSTILPYDNGVLPVVEKDFASEIRLLNEILTGTPDSLNKAQGKFTSGLHFGSIPLSWVYLIAGDQKLNVWRQLQHGTALLTSRDRRMLKDFLNPLYRQPTPGEWKILGAFAAAERFPFHAIDRILEVLTLPISQRPAQLNHAFALLAELYQKNRSYIEGQSVWNTLRTQFPSSVWVR